MFEQLRIQNGFYVDIGCYQPYQYSNTAFLHLAGWRGVNVDANIDNINQFNVYRPNDTNICCGVGKQEGDLDFYKFNPGDVSTFSQETAKKWQENGWELIEKIKIPVRTINNILDENVPKKQVIDYMNIDVEGIDEDVITSLDLQKHRPRIISIEIHDADIGNLSSNNIYTIMKRHNYQLKAVNLITYIFQSEDL